LHEVTSRDIADHGLKAKTTPTHGGVSNGQTLMSSTFKPKCRILSLFLMGLLASAAIPPLYKVPKAPHD
jgi:hypothetical protein